MSTASTPLRLAVLGCGRIGSTFAFHLARSGHDVTVVARPGSVRLEQLRRDGAIIDTKGRRAGVQVAEQFDEQAPYDLVVVTMPAHQATAFLPALRRSAAGCIQFMFNTFEPERLPAAVGTGRCALGMPFVQATLDGNGRLAATVGAAGQKTLMDRQGSVDLFNASGLPSALEPGMATWLRCHAPLCIAFESVSVAATRRGGGASWHEALVLSGGIHASFRLIKVLGYPVYPRSKRLLDRCPKPGIAAMLWSLSRVRSFRTLLATGEAECCALLDTMVAAATRTERPALVDNIKAMAP